MGLLIQPQTGIISGAACFGPPVAGATADDILIAALGGTSKIKAWYDARGGVNTSGSNVTTWDDFRGPAGFGPSLTGENNPTYDSVNKLVSCDGVNSYFDSAVNAAFDVSLGRTLVYIGSLPGTGYDIQFTDNALGPSQWMSINTQNPTICTTGVMNSVFAGITPSVTRRLAMVSISPMNFYGSGVGTAPNGPQQIFLLRDHVGAISAVGSNGHFGIDSATALSSGIWRLVVGGLASYRTPNVMRAILVIDHAITGAETLAIQTWASAAGVIHNPTIDTTNSRIVVFDGNSLTRGAGASGLATQYPSVVIAQTGLTTNLESVNLGHGGRTGTTQLAAAPYTAGPLLAGGHAKKAYVYWEITNDIQLGYSAATILANISATMATVKAVDANVKTVALTMINRAGYGSTENTKAQTVNTSLRDSSWRAANGVDFLADVEAISAFTIGSPDASKYDADGVHLNDAGYNLLATDATHGVTAQVTLALA